MSSEEFDEMINKLNTNRTINIKSHDEKCRVIAHYGFIYVFEEGKKEPYTFECINEFKVRWEVFNDEVQLNY